MRYSNRSLFYSLGLEGVGTGAVEGLRSYIQRLAMAHFMLPRQLLELLNAVLPFEGVGLKVLYLLKRWDIQSDSERGVQMLSRLEQATTVALGQGSMARFGKAFSSFDLFRKDWMYCPHCLAGGMRYTPLLWDISVVSACPVHKVKLLPVDCGAPAQEHLRSPQRSSSTVHCNKCGAFAFSCNHVSALPATSDEVWVSEQVSEVLALELSQEISATATRAGVRAVVDDFFNGKPIHAARESSLARADVHYWLKKEHAPSLGGLVALCLRSGGSLAELLRGRYENVREPATLDEVRACLPKRGYVLAQLNLDATRQRLLHEASQASPLSLAAVAKQLSTSTKRLGQLFPHEVGQLKAAREVVLEAARVRAFESAVEIYTAAAQRLTDSGASLYAKNVQKESGLVAHSMSPVRMRALTTAIKQSTGAAAR